METLFQNGSKFNLILGSDILSPYFYLILVASIYLSFRLGFPQIRFLFLALKILTGNMDFKGSKGQLVHSQAFFAGIGSSLLLGSVIGTALAIAYGGIGVLFWIWVMSLFVMPIRFVSSTLAVKFRNQLPSGRYLSGPMYFIEKALRAKWLAVAFSLASLVTVLLFGGIFPFVGLTYITKEGLNLSGLSGPISISVILLFIVIGGVRRVGRAASILAPIGIILFIFGYVSLFSGGMISFFGFLSDVTKEAFSIKALQGGGAFGVLRALSASLSTFFLSTETAVGKSSGIAGVVRTDYAAKQGLVSMLASFFEGFVMATLVGFVLYSYGAVNLETILAFPNRILEQKESLPAILFFVSFLCFGILSLAGWFYSGEQNAFYVFGEKFANFFRMLFIGSTLGFAYLYTKYGIDVLSIVMHWGYIAAVITSIPLLVSLMLLGKSANFELKKYLTESGARYEIFKDIYLLFLTLLPKNLISKLFGYFSMFKLPRFMMIPILKAFAKAYKINLSEAELEIKEYASLNQFFTRALRAEARIIDSAANAVVSPTDSKITSFGNINQSTIIQAKGIDYSVKELLGSEKYYPYFTNGKYITFYLSPQDYHRIHSPFAGQILGYYYEPGKLFPVNDLAVLNIRGLFPKNERLITFLQTEYGKIAVIKVGASNVGKIRVTYDNKIVTNNWIRFAKEHHYKDVSIMIDKGSELGRFEMGSTVILVFENDTIDLTNIALGDKIQYGTTVGNFRSKTTKLPVKA
ncbi:phosphatidylserine decarboxylase [Leptospira noumeaensis]|uniref:Phosphatidylserine decarboxylase proenzyme n=1 Tax=Leptospira noumeaensis TaxID=2484964 RepID=A0A4R9I1T8_9LEPT|nr:archaetidylserine decarboxylase [Leptospira noumeaensis]TGK78923.1 phosphatidylserine decarboxylase [Leptospira noumeaensis]